jgi:hypothetical protein
MSGVRDSRGGRCRRGRIAQPGASSGCRLRKIRFCFVLPFNISTRFVIIAFSAHPRTKAAFILSQFSSSGMYPTRSLTKVIIIVWLKGDSFFKRP